MIGKLGREVFQSLKMSGRAAILPAMKFLFFIAVLCMGFAALADDPEGTIVLESRDAKMEGGGAAHYESKKQLDNIGHWDATGFVPATGDFQKFAELDLGPLMVRKPGKIDVTVQVTRIERKDAMNLRAVKLVPAT